MLFSLSSVFLLGAVTASLLSIKETSSGQISVLVDDQLWLHSTSVPWLYTDDTRHSLALTSVEAWDLCQHINLRPHFFTAQKAAQGMAVEGGSIIYVSSVSYMMGNAGYPGYVAANAGINGLTRALARELGPQNIRVNSLMPGWVMTDKQLTMWATPESMTEHLQKQCLKTHLKPEDLVGATLFLASNASRMMTGQAIVVDGGVVVTG